jgi:ferritin-like protein
MTWNRITPRASARRALFFATALAALAAVFAGCGGGDGAAGGNSDKDADVELLNGVLSRQLAAVGAYERSIPALRGPAQETARRFRAQEQEHSVAIVKALRGLGAKSEPQPETIEVDDLRTAADHLAFLYEVEGATIDLELSAISKLSETWPRSLLGAIVANQAQHRLALRQLLGAVGPDAIPGAFENGTEPVPGEPTAGE